MFVVEVVTERQIQKALETLSVELPTQDDLDLLIEFYQKLPKNIEIKLPDHLDLQGRMNFVSAKRVEDAFDILIGDKERPTLSQTDFIGRISDTVNLLNIETTKFETKISINEPIGRVLDPDFEAFIEALASHMDSLFTLEFVPTKLRLLELAEKSEPYKALHGFPDLQFPNYVTVNRSAKRVFSKRELNGLQDAIVEQIESLGIPKSLILFQEQDCTITLQKNCVTADWIKKFAPRLFPFSHLGLRIEFLDVCPEGDVNPSTQQLLQFAIGRPVIQTKISNRYLAVGTDKESRNPSAIFRDVQSEYRKYFGSLISITDLAGADEASGSLRSLPSALRASVAPFFSNLGIVTKELPAIEWSPDQRRIFEESLDLESWKSLPNRSTNCLVVGVDPLNAKAEVGFSVEQLENGGYEICAYVLNLARLMPVYSRADDILFENCIYIPEIGMYPLEVAQAMALSTTEDRPLICVKTRVSPHGDRETEIFECKGKLDLQLTPYDAENISGKWAKEVLLHAKACEFLSQTNFAAQRIPVNEYEYCKFSYELHLLTYEMAGKWCAERRIPTPYRVTETPRATDKLFTSFSNDPRLKNLSARTSKNLRDTLLQTIHGLDLDTKNSLFKSIRATGYFSSNPDIGHWYLGYRNYVPLGGALRRDPSRLALHNITEYLNGHPGLNNQELEARLDLFNRQQNIDYIPAMRMIRDVRLKSLLINSVIETEVTHIISRNSTQTVKCSDGRMYELFYEDRIPLEAKLKIQITGYNLLSDTYRGEVVA